MSGPVRICGFLIPLLLLPRIPFASSLYEPRFDATLISALDHISRMEYSTAESLLVRIPGDLPARPYFLGLVYLNRFQDLGDTAALRRAEESWSRLYPKADSPVSFNSDSAQLHAFHGLATLQLSYIAALRGFQLRSASLVLTARGQLLSAAGIVEASAGLALLDYYREQLLGKIPWVHPNTAVPLEQLEAGADSSRYLRDMLLTSAFWMRIDRGETDSALKISENFLRRYPHNRLARQMEGSALFHRGKLPEARAEYENLLKEYGNLRVSLPSGSLPLGYLVSVGNLARIYTGLGMKTEADARLAEWQKACDAGLAPWLPTSLKSALDHLKNL